MTQYHIIIMNIAQIILYPNELYDNNIENYMYKLYSLSYSNITLIKCYNHINYY